MEAFMHQKKSSINFSKAKIKLYFILHDDSSNSYFFVKEKENYNFKASYKNVKFTTKNIGYADEEDVFLKGNMYDFSVDYEDIDKSGIIYTQN